MASQDTVAYRALTNHRAQEIKDSASFRWFMLISNFLCKLMGIRSHYLTTFADNTSSTAYCPLTLSPPLLFGVYVATASNGYDFSVSKVFTSLVIVTLLSAPLVRLFQVVPQLGGAQGCFHRLHKFLLLEERDDYRETMKADEKYGADDTQIISLRDVSFGWDSESSPVLKNISLRIKRGTRVAITGSVGTGKSLFLRGLIGEAHKIHGQVVVSPSITIAYCSQTPWLENVTAQQNLTHYGWEPNNSEFCKSLMSECALEDVVKLPTFASESVGSGGVKLSGGQRQRLVSLQVFSLKKILLIPIQALARALSTKSDILILDDVFSALDQRTKQHIAQSLLGQPSSNTERTIIYTTHDGMIALVTSAGPPSAILTIVLAEHIANMADEVYHIDKMGHLSPMSYLGLPKRLDLISTGQEQYGDRSEVDSLEATNPRPPPSGDKPKQVSGKLQAPLISIERQAAKQTLGDRAVYKTYFKSVGFLHTTIFLFGAMAWSVSFKFPGKSSRRMRCL